MTDRSPLDLQAVRRHIGSIELVAPLTFLEKQLTAAIEELESARREIEELRVAREVWDASIKGAWAEIEDLREKRKALRCPTCGIEGLDSLHALVPERTLVGMFCHGCLSSFFFAARTSEEEAP